MASPDDQHDDIEFEDETNTQDIADKLKKVKKELAECKKERQEYLEGWQRLRADVANQKRDEAKGSQEMRQRIRAEAGQDILPVLDSFEMAMRGDAWHQVDTTWRTGVEQIAEQLRSIVYHWGLEPFGEIGDAFDPNIHEAVETREPENGESEDSIVEVQQRGYRMNGEVIRPARVVVARS